MKPLPDPFAPPATYARRVALLARLGLSVCPRCGEVGIAFSGSYFPCLGCGTLLVYSADAPPRDPTQAELATMRRSGRWAGVRDEHDRIIRQICPND